jgi:hypothetical protein
VSSAATREETQVASLLARQTDGMGQQSSAVDTIIAHKRGCSTSAADANTRRAAWQQYCNIHSKQLYIYSSSLKNCKMMRTKFIYLYCVGKTISCYFLQQANVLLRLIIVNLSS